MAIYPMDSVIQSYEQPRPGLVRKNRNTNSLHSQSKVYLNEKKKKKKSASKHSDLADKLHYKEDNIFAITKNPKAS